MKQGDWVKQDRGDEQTFALLAEKLKNGSFKAVAWDSWRRRAFSCSIKGWYPAPVVVDVTSVPVEAVEKIGQVPDHFRRARISSIEVESIAAQP